MVGSRLRGDELAALRRQAGFSQVELASSLGVSNTRVSEWERGDVSRPHPRQLLAIADAVGVDALRLLDCDPTDPPLLALRLRAGLSLHEVAERTALPYSNYRRLEQGLRRRVLPQTMLEALAVAFGVSAGEVQRAIDRSLSEAGS